MAKKAVTKKGKSTRRKEPETGDVIRVQHIGAGAAIAAGREAKASIVNNQPNSSIGEWMAQVNNKIESLPNVSEAEKEEMKQQVEKIGAEVEKGPKAEVGRLEKLINAIGVMAPDIFDVVLATLTSPLTGIGLVLRKVGDKAKLEKNSGKA